MIDMPSGGGKKWWKKKKKKKKKKKEQKAPILLESTPFLPIQLRSEVPFHKFVLEYSEPEEDTTVVVCMRRGTISMIPGDYRRGIAMLPGMTSDERVLSGTMKKVNKLQPGSYLMSGR
ncbi:unnamed protein product [Caenorhabditis auriculariae]|uniref:Uncharacterized protein n=1 Tax=Caenorhabditis auriculariae TaxID=2777116 RepID=A0A8S1HDD9_9PELO|nr:unnamed protein product [Caenorhabditis auriculariae]